MRAHGGYNIVDGYLDKRIETAMRRRRCEPRIWRSSSRLPHTSDFGIEVAAEDVRCDRSTFGLIVTSAEKVVEDAPHPTRIMLKALDGVGPEGLAFPI